MTPDQEALIVGFAIATGIVVGAWTALRYVHRRWPGRISAMFKGFSVLLFRVLMGTAAVLFLVLVALSLGEEYRLLVMAPALRRWLINLLVLNIVAIIVMVMAEGETVRAGPSEK